MRAKIDEIIVKHEPNKPIVAILHIMLTDYYITSNFLQ